MLGLLDSTKVDHTQQRLVQTLNTVGVQVRGPSGEWTLPQPPVERMNKRPLPAVHKLKLIQQLSAPWKLLFP